jgi:hypothetical protein
MVLLRAEVCVAESCVTQDDTSIDLASTATTSVYVTLRWMMTLRRH